MILRFLMTALLLAVSPVLLADAITGEVQKQATNYTAIIMFVVFIVFTMGITKWAAKRNTSTADYYTAGGSITGFQNGLAIAGDFMSAASFLGISALVYTSGYDGLIYSIGFLVGWPIILFLMAERLRNLGKFTFSDVASYRLGQTQIRLLSAFGSLIVVAFYLIAQMVGAGKLIQLLFGLDYYVASRGAGRCADGHVRAVRRHARHHLGADHQGGPAAVRRLFHGHHGDEECRFRLWQPVRRSSEDP